MSYRLYHIDSKGEKRYLQTVSGTQDWVVDSEEVALKRRWSEAQQGVVLEIESDNVTPVSNDEQGDRIRENWAEARENLQDYSLSDLEDIFEDRDPLEFIW